MNLLERITVIPDVCNGKPTIRGMRITVKTIVEFIAAGESVDNILKATHTLRRMTLKQLWNMQPWLPTPAWLQLL